jgi:hypothetical protein
MTIAVLTLAMAGMTGLAVPGVGVAAARTGPHALPPPTGGPGSQPATELVRHDGRVDQFAVATPVGADPLSARYVWYRPQLAPGGQYGDWTRLSNSPVSTRWPFLQLAENVDGRIEVFFAGMQIYRLYQDLADGPWSEQIFSLPSPPWWGGPAVASLDDGRLAYTQTTSHVYGHQVGTWYVTQVSPGGSWGTWEYLGTGPFSVAVTYPSLSVDPGDGTAHITASMWSASACVAHIDQLPSGEWSPWSIDPASPAACPTA